jgi:hypothetical protein
MLRRSVSPMACQGNSRQGAWGDFTHQALWVEARLYELNLFVSFAGCPSWSCAPNLINMSWVIIP